MEKRFGHGAVTDIYARGRAPAVVDRGSFKSTGIGDLYRIISTNGPEVEIGHRLRKYPYTIQYAAGTAVGAYRYIQPYLVFQVRITCIDQKKNRLDIYEDPLPNVTKSKL